MEHVEALEPGLQSEVLSSLAHVVHAFGTKAHPIDATRFPDWDRLRPQWKQVHGVGVARVIQAQQPCGEVDALWTSEQRLPIGVLTADCVPILLARRDGRAVAALHAGWRGTLARIVEVFFRELREAGETPGDWVAAVGPAARACCYEVGEDLIEDFSREFGEFRSQWSEIVPETRRIQLQVLNTRLLQRVGVSAVEVLEACTICDPRFASYRRDRDQSRQFALIAPVEASPSNREEARKTS